MRIRKTGLGLLALGVLAMAACDEGLLELPPEEEFSAGVMEMQSSDDASQTDVDRQAQEYMPS